MTSGLASWIAGILGLSVAAPHFWIVISAGSFLIGLGYSLGICLWRALRKKKQD